MALSVLSNLEIENYGILGRHENLFPWKWMQEIPPQSFCLQNNMALR